MDRPWEHGPRDEMEFFRDRPWDRDHLVDVPVERESIGAMSLVYWQAREEKPFKPYVYRGTGEDQFPETYEPPPKPKVRSATVEEVRARQRANEVARIKYAAKKARREAAARRREWERHQRVTTVRTVLDPPDPRYDRLVFTEPSEEEPEPVLVLVNPARPKPRPAKGWQPVKGADIDDMMKEFGL